MVFHCCGPRFAFFGEDVELLEAKLAKKQNKVGKHNVYILLVCTLKVCIDCAMSLAFNRSISLITSPSLLLGWRFKSNTCTRPIIIEMTSK
jgi:hypothetical protein